MAHCLPPALVENPHLAADRSCPLFARALRVLHVFLLLVMRGCCVACASLVSIKLRLQRFEGPACVYDLLYVVPV